MKVAIILLVRDPDPLEPFDTTTTDVPGDHQAHGITMVWWQSHIVHFICQDYVVFGVHHIRQWNGCRVSALAELIGTFKMNPTWTLYEEGLGGPDLSG